MKKLLILGGPTAVGKTDISIKLAKKLNGEIISADSMQIYKYMNIGSAKVSEEEKQGIEHHMIDIVTPERSFSVAEFKNEAEKIIDAIQQKGKLPMIVGGTGLYINSVIYNYSFTEANKDEKYRQELEKLAETKGKEYVHNMLKDVDAISAENIHYNNLKKVIRALEVYKVTGKKFSDYNSEKKVTANYELDYFVLTMNREKLYKRINERVDLMLKNGLLDEVKHLKQMGFNEYMQSMQGIGYKEILMYLNGDIAYDDAVNMIKQGSRNYAKRQLTWFRKDKAVAWINKDLFKNDDEIVQYILNRIFE